MCWLSECVYLKLSTFIKKKRDILQLWIRIKSNFSNIASEYGDPL